MKKFLAIMLVFILLVSVVACGKADDAAKDDENVEVTTAAVKHVYQEEGSDDKFGYAVNAEGDYDIVSFDSVDKMHKVTIPSDIDGIPVTGIADEAFKSAWQITEIVIPDTVKYIGVAAFFDCKYLEKVDMADSVIRISEAAFKDCIALDNLTLSKGLVEIGDGAFFGCASLKKIAFTDKVETIGKGAFQNCTALAEVSISASVKEIKDGAFQGCTALKSIEIPATVEVFGKFIFTTVTAGNKDFKIIAAADSAAAAYATANEYTLEAPTAE